MALWRLEVNTVPWRFACRAHPHPRRWLKCPRREAGRAYLVWKVNFLTEKVGEMDTQLFKEWFQAVAQAAGITLHVETLYGVNSHHIAESCFKAFARALRQAVEIDPRRSDDIPSTKGILGDGSVD